MESDPSCKIFAVSEASFKYPARAGDVTEAMLALPAEQLQRLSRYPLTILPTKPGLYSYLADLMAARAHISNQYEYVGGGWGAVMFGQQSKDLMA